MPFRDRELTVRLVPLTLDGHEIGGPLSKAEIAFCVQLWARVPDSLRSRFQFWWTCEGRVKSERLMVIRCRSTESVSGWGYFTHKMTGSLSGLVRHLQAMDGPLVSRPIPVKVWGSALMSRIILSRYWEGEDITKWSTLGSV